MTIYKMMDRLHDELVNYYGGESQLSMAKMNTPTLKAPHLFYSIAFTVDEFTEATRRLSDALGAMRTSAQEEDG